MKLAVYITHGLTPAVTSKAVMVSTGGVPAPWGPVAQRLEERRAAGSGRLSICAWAYAVRVETLIPMTKVPEPNSKRHMMSIPHWDVVGTASLGKRNFCTRKLLESDT